MPRGDRTQAFEMGRITIVNDLNEGMIEEAWQRIARVAIEAMREPTKVMLRAGSEYIADADHSGHRRTEAERKADEAWEGTAARETANMVGVSYKT